MVLTPQALYLAAGHEQPPLEHFLLQTAPVWRRELAAWGPWQEMAAPLAGWGWWAKSIQRVGAPVVVVPQCGSSLDVVAGLPHETPAWSSVLAIGQSAGRGQLRRPWYAQPGNILAAVRWPRPPAALEPLLPLLIGLSCVGAFAELGLSLEIKWPNDLLWQGKKVGGVLVEERDGLVAAGIGLNLVSAPGDAALREPWACPAGDLAASSLQPAPLSLWMDLVKRAQSWYETEVYGVSPRDVMEQLQAYLWGWGREVQVVPPGEPPFTAVLAGIEPDGGLRLHTPSGGRTLYNGSYTLPSR
ncbi:MAG: biotin--[acetyl-CoA-carboxylase] ligase [Desulfohalobium sp.]